MSSRGALCYSVHSQGPYRHQCSAACGGGFRNVSCNYMRILYPRDYARVLKYTKEHEQIEANPILSELLALGPLNIYCFNSHY